MRLLSSAISSGAMSQVLPKRPHLLRAMHQWITDCGNTPRVIVDAGRERRVPRAMLSDGKIVLNLSEGATQRLRLGGTWWSSMRASPGLAHHVRFPVSAVLGIYARARPARAWCSSEQDPRPSPRIEPAGCLTPPMRRSAAATAEGRQIESRPVSRVLSRAIIPLGSRVTENL